MSSTLNNGGDTSANYAVSESTSKDHDLGQYKETVLVRWSDMPRHLQFNPYIYTGYRPVMNVWGCIASLFYVHNETINILTHGKSLLHADLIPHSILYTD